MHDESAPTPPTTPTDPSSAPAADTAPAADALERTIPETTAYVIPEPVPGSAGAASERADVPQPFTPEPVVLTSKRKAGIPRMVCVFCPDLWSGPQPGVVSGGPFVEPITNPVGSEVIEQEGQVVNVNALVDAANNPRALAVWRGRREGNTMCSVPLYDALTPEQRAQVAPRSLIGTDSSGNRYFAWCEWPSLTS
jgi:hypothetical protein